MTQLADFLTRENITQQAFAKSLGVNQATVSKFVQGKARPGLDLALAIERTTNGAVPVAVWERPEGAA